MREVILPTTVRMSSGLTVKLGATVCVNGVCVCVYVNDSQNMYT